MKQKKIPLRSCVVTREKFPKQELLRIVRDKDGTVSIDETGKANGRGAYIKKDVSILDKMRKSNALGRHLECDIPEEIYEQIRKIMES